MSSYQPQRVTVLQNTSHLQSTKQPLRQITASQKQTRIMQEKALPALPNEGEDEEGSDKHIPGSISQPLYSSKVVDLKDLGDDGNRRSDQESSCYTDMSNDRARSSTNLSTCDYGIYWRSGYSEDTEPSGTRGSFGLRPRSSNPTSQIEAPEAYSEDTESSGTRGSFGLRPRSSNPTSQIEAPEAYSEDTESSGTRGSFKLRPRSSNPTSQIEAPERPILERSASWGNTAGGHSPYLDPNFNYFGNKVHNPHRPPTPQTPGYAQYDYFDENNLSKRPRDWRPDFVARQALTAYIPAVLGRSNSIVKDYSDPIKRVLHPLIAYKSPIPPFYYDLRLPGFSLEYANFGPILNRAANDIDYHQLALLPTCSFVRIFHPKLPWYIDVHQVHPNGITVIDVLSAIGNQMHEAIRPRHFWNDELGDAERKMITLAFQERVANNEVLMRNGVVQVDFLGPKCVLEGFVRGSKGMWEMKTRKPDD